jgi:antitoxin component of MazEF toxin-antitoxin module
MKIKYLGRRKVGRQHQSAFITIPKLWCILADVIPGDDVELFLRGSRELVIACSRQDLTEKGSESE